MPTALDNGQRSPRKLLASVVRRLVLVLVRTFSARQASEDDPEERVPHRCLGEGAAAGQKGRDSRLAPCRVKAVDEVGKRIEANVFGHCHAEGE